ncbi:head-to-tail adaptor [Gordonia phage Kuwabara]|nr:head-to-tail adaptor [Gordonia phage Kuwabara]
MPLATTTDVAARLGAAFDNTDPGAVEQLLEVASDLAAAWMRCVPDPVPAEVTRVVAGMVARTLSVDPTVSPGETQSQQIDTAGPMSQTRSRSFDADSTQRQPWLTKNDKIVLRQFGCRGTVQNVSTA